MTQVHMRFSDHRVKELIERYIHHEVDLTYIQEVLGIGKARFLYLRSDTGKTPLVKYPVKRVMTMQKVRTEKIGISIKDHIEWTFQGAETCEEVQC